MSHQFVILFCSCN